VSKSKWVIYLLCFTVLVLLLALVYSFNQKPYLATDAISTENLLLPDGARYKGELKNGLMHGQGELRWLDGAHYQGEFAGGIISGAGTLVDAMGNQYLGTFADGKLIGEGEYRSAEGSFYRGEFAQGRFHGKGEFQNLKVSVIRVSLPKAISVAAGDQLQY